jgi:hypothetical protein
MVLARKGFVAGAGGVSVESAMITSGADKTF